MEGEYLLLSGIQHFCFCRRQWALIHLEQQWQENLRTAEGRLDHTRCHDDTLREKRRDLLTVRGMQVVSHTLRLRGVCDVVEFRADPAGVPLQGLGGLWQPLPVEYKHGTAKENDADRLQLCAQAICLEEMLCCDIPYGYIYYGEVRHREKIEFTQELRRKVKDMFAEMHKYYRQRYTPKVKWSKSCNACSLKDICLPVLNKNISVKSYLDSRIKEEGPD